MNAGALLVVYHGCDITTRDDLVSHRTPHLDHSVNEYDWLGPGAYFFENDAQRALNFASSSHDAPEALYTKRPIATPAVVGAILCIHHCLDMTTQAGIDEFAQAHDPMVANLREKKHLLPKNDRERPLLRKLDNAVFSYIHDVRKNVLNAPGYQAVRGAFSQGDPITPHSGFHRETHVQLAVRENSCVVGWFLPPGAKLLAPDEYQIAKAALAKMPTGADRKARKRPAQSINPN